jgi:hypothetical protein
MIIVINTQDNRISKGGIEKYCVRNQRAIRYEIFRMKKRWA